jgi:hypothetical protein
VHYIQLFETDRHCYLCQLAVKPKRYVSTWTAYRVNGFKFHTEARSVGKRTYNCGVGVCGTGEGDVQNDYYGVLKDIIEIEYVGEPVKRCVLFSCEWFDPTLNRGTRTHKLCNLIEVHRTRRYRKYDPFIFPSTASQVYFMPHPDRSRDRANWLVVIPTKPRARVDQQYTLPTAYQQTDMTTTIEPVTDTIPSSLVDESAPPEDVDNEIGSAFIQGNDQIDEVEDDNGDEEGEWDDGIETDEEGEGEDDEVDDEEDVDD